MNKDDCSKHLKSVAGIEDMKVLAEMIGDLHYETLYNLMYELRKKINNDAFMDYAGGRRLLADNLTLAANHLNIAGNYIRESFEISKQFMNKKKAYEFSYCANISR